MTDMHRRNNVTLVLVTHDAESARQADRQIVLRDGSVVNDESRSLTVREGSAFDEIHAVSETEPV